jgi:asparagine synthetase B (glutamine-hydrolysing)
MQTRIDINSISFKAHKKSVVSFEQSREEQIAALRGGMDSSGIQMISSREEKTAAKAVSRKAAKIAWAAAAVAAAAVETLARFNSTAESLSQYSRTVSKLHRKWETVVKEVQEHEAEALRAVARMARAHGEDPADVELSEWMQVHIVCTE